MSADVDAVDVPVPGEVPETPRATMCFEGDGVDVRATLSPSGTVQLSVRYDTPGDRRNWVSLSGSPAEIEATLEGLRQSVDVVVDAVASLAPGVPAVQS